MEAPEFFQRVTDRGWKEPCNCERCVKKHIVGVRFCLKMNSKVGVVPVPRCASRSTRAVIEEKAEEVLQISDPLNPPKGLPEMIISVIRDPIDRFVSMCLKGGYRDSPITRLPFRQMKAPERILQFTRDLKAYGLCDGHFLPQCSFFQLGKPVELLPFNSSLSTAYPAKLKSFGFEVNELPNDIGQKMTKPEYSEYVMNTPEILDFINEHYARDMELWKQHSEKFPEN